MENGDGECPGPRAAQEKIRVIRRSSRWKNKPRQANKEDNEILEDSGEDERSSKLVCHQQTIGVH